MHLSNVQCSGTEDTLFDCNFAVIPGEVSVNVADLDVAGVICRSAPTSTPSISNTIIGTAAIPNGTGIELPLLCNCWLLVCCHYDFRDHCDSVS